MTPGTAAPVSGARRERRAADARRGTTELVGRDSEFQALLRAARRRPAVALIEGEPGVGKTRLVEALQAHPTLRDALHLTGHCQPLREPFPLGPIVAALSKLEEAAPGRLPAITGSLQTLIPELAPILPAPPDPLDDPRAERHRVLRGVVELFAALGPTVLVLEDVQWAGEDTVECIQVLAAETPEELCMVLTFRREDLPATSPLHALDSRASRGLSALRLTLEPLDTAGVKDLVAGMLEGGDIPDQFARSLHEKTSGVPFAIEEVVRLLVDRGDLVLREGRWTGWERLDGSVVPDAVRSSVVERLSRLSTEAQAAMNAIAVLRVPALEPTLRRVAGLRSGDAVAALLELLHSGLVVEGDGGTILPRHALARQAVYEAIPGPVRRRIHRRAAAALRDQQPAPSAQLAYHYREAGEVRQWVKSAEAAGDAAAALGDFAAAVPFLQEAFEAPGLPRPTRVRLAVKLGEAASHGLDDARAIQILRGFLRDEQLPRGARGELRFALGGLLIQQGDASASHEEFRRAVTDLRSGNPSLASRAMSALAVPCFLEERLRDHRRWATQATDLAARHGDRHTRVAVAVNRLTLEMSEGDPRAWEGMAGLRAERGSSREKRERVRAAFNLASSAFHLGHYARAEELLVEGQELSRELSYGRLVPALDVMSLLLRWATGRWEGLEAAAEVAMESVGDELTERAEALFVSGCLAAARGDHRAAGQRLETSARLSRRSGWLPIVAAAGGALARVRLAEGEPEQAAAVATDAADAVRRKGIWAWGWGIAPPLALSFSAAGRGAEAERFVTTLGRGLRGCDAPAASVSYLMSRGHLLSARDPSAAARWFSRAATAAERMGNPYEAAVARGHGGQALLSVGAGRGEAELRAALASFESLGAAGDATAMRGAFARFGVPAPSRRGRKGYGSELSPRERDVARMVAVGKTNREVAAALYLSERTVAHHLTSAMRKLGVRSRTALALSTASERDRQQDRANSLGHSDDHKDPELT